MSFFVILNDLTFYDIFILFPSVKFIDREELKYKLFIMN